MYPVWLLLGYLLGSCPTGLILVKLFNGQDIRQVGSGNIGATNVGRVLGKKWAVVTALVDIAKGGVAVLLASFVSLSPALIALVGVSAVLGHNYPVWIGFKGGKGVATTFGVISCFDFFNPFPVLCAGIIWYGTMYWSRYVSLASIVSLFSIPLFMRLFDVPVEYQYSSIFLAVLSTWRHRSNVMRLLSGTESKITPKQKN